MIFLILFFDIVRVRGWGPARRYVIPGRVGLGSCGRSRVLVLVLVALRCVLSGGSRRVGRDPPVATHPGGRPTQRDHGYPWISMDIGPCFGMNGHFRRDPDVISRLPDTTINSLSVLIGFRC